MGRHDRLWKGILISGLLLIAAASAQAEQHHRFQGDHEITVMTRNLYFGADLSSLLAAPNLDALIAGVTTVFGKAQFTDFRQRALALADEIAAVEPDLVGLQEAVIWRSQFPPDGPVTPASKVEYDFLQILLDALADRGLRYEPVVVSDGFDAEAPRLAVPGTPLLQDIRLTDRDVLLARQQHRLGDQKLSNPQAAKFAANVTFQLVGQTISSGKGWVAVDVNIRGKKFRVVNTHLEVPEVSAAVQLAQGAELLAGPADTNLPVILIGDLNSRADGTGTATYGNLIAAGFVDAWTIANPANDGNTCCQSELLFSVAPFDKRVDVVLFRGDFSVANAKLVGANPTFSNPPLWASDHAGVAATLEFR